MTNEIKLDEKKLTRLKYEILKLENENIKERKYTRSAMIDTIRKIIIEEVDRCF